MKDCPTIFFDSIKQNKKTNQLKAIVWRRSRIALELEMTESQLVEMVLLKGNDFTKQCSWDFEINRYSLEEVRQFILSQPIDYKLSSSLPKELNPLEYSRDLYELNDLSIYPYDPPHIDTPTTLIRSELIQNYEGVLFRYDSERIKSLIHFDQIDNLISIVSNYLREYHNSSSSSSSSTINNSILEYSESISSILIHSHYLEIFNRLLPVTSVVEDEWVTVKSKQKKKVVKKWEDYVVIDQFEQLLKCLYEEIFDQYRQTADPQLIPILRSMMVILEFFFIFFLYLLTY